MSLAQASSSRVAKADSLARSREALLQSLEALGEAWRSVPDEGRASAASVLSTENAFDKINREFGLLTSAQVAEQVGTKSVNRQWASEQRRLGKLLGFRRGRRDYLYPGYQFDDRGGVRDIVLKVAEIANEAGAHESDVVLWFVSKSRWFPNDGRPVDHLDSVPELVVEAAHSVFDTQW
ncbi:hypothetical protein LWF01_04005 [Saxibacter everestensis]|uniref:Antitoxin Xre/MbcA/ParS-like toxin-binding domain-containing protein n=1 Tax=Saxibacter everestensis TaxID=2909229 RepID=A0ABY8QWZ6_9MICO|nr:hypothetical protein LWF01_04005 [Brevibacteriaceae bacterium ZFBP1038]